MRYVESLKALKRRVRKNTLSLPPEIIKYESELLQCLTYTGIGISGLITNFMAAIYVKHNNIYGHIVETGIFKSGSLASFYKVLYEDSNKRYYGYDTFKGMIAPKEIDGQVSVENFRKLRINDYSSNWGYCSVEDVKKNLIAMSIDIEKFYFIEGRVEETLQESKNLPSQISILRLDTDWYESTRTSLEVLYPLVVSGGIVIIDDYGKWPGCKIAVDEYFSKKVRPFMNPVGHVRVFVKP